MQKHDKVKAVNQLGRLEKEARKLAHRNISEKKKIAFSKWHAETESALRIYFGEQSLHYKAFTSTDFKLDLIPTAAHRTAMRSIANTLGILAKEIAQHWPEPNHSQINLGESIHSTKTHQHTDMASGKHDSKNENDRRAIRHAFRETFSLDELKGMCFDLSIEYEDFPANKEAFLTALLKHAFKKKLVDKLLNWVDKSDSAAIFNSYLKK